MQAQIVPSLADAISATMVKGEKRSQKKNEYPVIDDPQLRAHVDKQVEAANIEKKAKAENGFHKNIIADYVRKVMDRDGYAGRFSGTYVVMGNVHTVNCTFADKWRIEDEAALKAVLGNNFDQLFEKRTVVKLKKEVLENPELANRLMVLIGHEFVDFFESEENYTIREDTDVKRGLYNLVPQDKLELFRQWAKQAAPSIVAKR